MTAPDMDEEREGLAAEFVLGTLSAAERADMVFRLRTDPELKRAVEAWEARLSPLNETAAPIEPPEGLEASINRRIAGLGGYRSEVAVLRRRLRSWQTASLVTGAIAAGLAALILVRPPEPGAPAPASGNYVAVLQAEGPGPAFVAAVDLGARNDLGQASRRAGPKRQELRAVGGWRRPRHSRNRSASSMRV